MKSPKIIQRSNADHSQIIGGDAVKLLGGIYSGFRHPWSLQHTLLRKNCYSRGTESHWVPIYQPGVEFHFPFQQEAFSSQHLRNQNRKISHLCNFRSNKIWRIILCFATANNSGVKRCFYILRSKSEILCSSLYSPMIKWFRSGAKVCASTICGPII